ncbi:MAG: chemotaxis protein CheW [bacterium]
MKQDVVKKEVVKLVTFQLGQDLFAADIFSVERVVHYAPSSSVPDMPEWIEGVLEHRGKVIPVVDMRRRIAIPITEITPQTRILVLTTPDGWVGAVVDAVLEVAIVAATDVSPPPALFHGLPGQFIRGIAKVGEKLIVILEIDRVLASADRIVFDRAIQAAQGAGRD